MVFILITTDINDWINQSTGGPSQSNEVDAILIQVLVPARSQQVEVDVHVIRLPLQCRKKTAPLLLTSFLK